MIKTIKITKEMNFRELIEYILDNNIENKHFDSDKNKRYQRIYVKENGVIFFTSHLDYNIGETYEVDVVEEITEDTVFHKLVEIYDKSSAVTHCFKSIKEVKDNSTKNIYAVIDGKLQLVWECE